MDRNGVCNLTFFRGRQRVVLEAELDVVEDVVDALHALQLEGVGALLQLGRDVVHAALQLGVPRLPLAPDGDKAVW